MKNLFKNWGAFRIIRMILSIIIAVVGFYKGDMLLIVMGLGVGALTIFNSSCCCSADGCEIPQRESAMARRPKTAK